MNKDDFKKKADELANFMDSLIKIHGKPYFQRTLFEDHEKQNELALKLDVFERAIELVRIRLRCLNNELDFDKFIQSEISAKSDHLFYRDPISFERNRLGTAPIHLQPKLLMYLLYRHNNKKQTVYNIIENFIKLLWNQLELLDFEKTKTGVMRCFTNTRFSANKLREYGMLKFTKQEAYKTWVLSFTGIMVASKFLKDGEWGKPLYIAEYSSDLHPGIRSSFKSLKNYDEFIETLMFVAKPETKLIKENSIGTKKTHELLSAYHSLLKNPDITKKEKKKRCTSILEEFENDKDVMNLFEKLSLDLKVGDLKQLQ